MHDLLRPEWDQHGGAFGGEGAQSLDAAQAVGQYRVQTILLLPAQRGKLAQMPASHRKQRFGVAVQLFFGVGQMHQRYKAEHHPLVAGGQVVQHLLGFPALKLHVVGNHRRPVAVGVLLSLPVVIQNGPFPAHKQQRLVIGKRGKARPQAYHGTKKKKRK